MSDSIAHLLGPIRPTISNNPEPGALVPHVYSFNAVLNNSAQIYSYRHDEALRHLPSNALAMRRDGFVESLLQERILPNAQRPWSIRVPKPKDPVQAKVREVVTKAIQAIPRFNSMRANLLEAIWYGRYGSQVQLCQKTILGAPTWTVHSHRPVNGDKIHYGWDGTPAVAINPITRAGFPLHLTKNTDRGMVVLRLERPEHRQQFVIHRHLVTDADFFEPEMAGGIAGIGLRSKIYWNWWLRDEMLSWAVDFMQKVGTLGLLIFTHEDGNDGARRAAEDAAARASNETALIMPMPPGQGQKQTNAVQHIQASPGGIEALMAIISDYFERHIERLVIGQPSSGGVAGGGGQAGSAGAALHADTKYQIVKWDAENLDETLTIDLVQNIILKLNFPDEIDFPVEFVSAVNNPEDAAKMQSITQGAALGCTYKREEVMAMIGMSVPEDGDDVVGGVQNTPGNPEGIDEGLTEPGQGLTHNAVIERRNGSGSGNGLEKKKEPEDA